MAISPKVTYPAQITVSDPNYPRGKARNVNTPGDSAGTPFEQTWLNDLWGWQQALLAAAGATPSGTPDQVGASQYLDAIMKLTTQLTPSYEYGYSNYRLRSVLLNLETFVTVGSAAYAMTHMGAAYPGAVYAVTPGVCHIPFRLPTGSRMTRIRAAVVNASGSMVTVTCHQVRAGLVAPYTPTKTIVGSSGDNPATVGLLDADTTGIALQTVGATDRFIVELETTAVAQTIPWIEISFQDVGPSNF